MEASAAVMPLAAKVRIAGRIGRTLLLIALRDPAEPLPRFVARLGRVEGRCGHVPPPRLRSAVLRALRLGPWRPTCLVHALVLFRLLREQGDAAELVIGLPEGARDRRAHAWVELGGQDLGPIPGAGHRALARFA